MKVEPQHLNEQNPLISEFTTSPKEISTIIELYLSRKLAEEIDFLEENDGVNSLVERLKTNTKQGLYSSDDHSCRKKTFGTNKPKKEESLTY